MAVQTNGLANGHTNGEAEQKILRVGLIGCGEIAQVAHIPTLNHLSAYFRITYLCDVSQKALAHCVQKVTGSTPPQTTTSAAELCASPEVDCVLICNATGLHPTHAILALQHNKHVLVEKPLAVSYADLTAIAAAEKTSSARVFVGYMRRYAPAFQAAVRELGPNPLPSIQYVRVRDIIGPNATFVEQSGTFPKKFTDFPADASEELAKLDAAQAETTLLHEFNVPNTPETRRMLAILGGLGSHDLSAMREILGGALPTGVVGASMGFPMWSALLQYKNFTVCYESGINGVPIFDAHIEVYTDRKIVRVNYDSPYVKGLPTTMTVRELLDDGSYSERMVRTTYEDAYTVELREWWECVVNGREVKTSVADARGDLDIFKMLMQAGFEKKV